MTQEDTPIIYCSDAFCDLTGYSHSDVLGRNCRFLQTPGAADRPASREGTIDKVRVPGSQSQTVDLQHELQRMKQSLSRNEEVQVVLLNYKKSGKAFLNLVTVVPVDSDNENHRYFVGFQAASIPYA